MYRGKLITVAIFSAAILFALLAAPMFLGHVYVADDLGEFHLPLRAFYAQQLARGEPFDWCPDLYCGFYLTGEGQVGAYHPLHLLLYHTMPLSMAFDLECLLSYPAMFVGMVMFLGRRRLRLPAVLLGATAFTFGSFNFLHFVHPNAVAVVAHLPWLLWAIDVMLCGQNVRQQRLAFVATAALTGSQWLLGYPQYAVFSLIVEAGYVVFLMATQCTPHAPREEFFTRSVKSTLSWLAAVAIGTLLGGVQLLPTFDALQHSVRQSPAAELADPGSLHPLNLVQLVGPYLFTRRVVGQNTHELGLYVGAVPLVLAVWGVMFGLRQRGYRPFVIAAIIVACFSLLWAFGTHGPFGWLQTNVPLLDKFRLPCRAIVVFQLAMAVLAAVGFSMLLRRGASHVKGVGSRCREKTFQNIQAASDTDSRPLQPWYDKTALPWSLVIFSTIVAATAPLLWPQQTSAWPLVWIGPLLTVFAVSLLSRAIRGAVWAIAAMIVLTAIDLGAYGMTYAIIGQTVPLDEFIGNTNVPSGTPNCRVALDLLAGTQTAPGDGGVRIGDRILLTGWKRVDGYAGLEPARQLDYRNPAALQIAGVGWILSTEEQQNHWTQLSAYQPRARLVTQAIVSDNPTADLSVVCSLREQTSSRGAKGLHSGKAALVDSPLELPTAAPGEVTIRHDRPGNFLCETDCSTAQLLIVNESYHPGWRAIIDGQSATVVRANGDFQGLVVPAGRHEIRLQFLPNSLKFGRIVSCCGLGLLVAALLLATRQNRRLPTSPDAFPPPADER